MKVLVNYSHYGRTLEVGRHVERALKLEDHKVRYDADFNGDAELDAERLIVMFVDDAGAAHEFNITVEPRAKEGK